MRQRQSAHRLRRASLTAWHFPDSDITIIQATMDLFSYSLVIELYRDEKPIFSNIGL